MIINFPVEKFAENGKSIEPVAFSGSADRIFSFLDFNAGTPDFWGPGFKMPSRIRQWPLWNSI